MGTLTLNDGTVLQSSYALLMGDSLFIYVQQEGMMLIPFFNLFCDPEKTAEIIYTEVNAEEITYRWFEKLTAVRDEGNGLFTAVLKRGEINVGT